MASFLVISILLLSTQLFNVRYWEQSKKAVPQHTYGGEWGRGFFSFKTSALDGGEWSASRPGRALPPAKTPGIHCTGGWVVPRAALETEAREKNIFPLPGIEPRSLGRPVRSQTLYWPSYPAPETSRALLYDSEINAISWSVQIPAPNKKTKLFSHWTLIQVCLYLLRGATVLVELWPPHVLLYERFHDNEFLQGGFVSHALNPNLEDQGISLSLASPSKPVRHGWPYQQLCCRRHSVRVHWCTQAPSHSNKVLSTRWRHHRGEGV
jgi:hypothetical protein